MPLCFTRLRVRDCHPLRTDFPDGSTHLDLAITRSHNPAKAGTSAVWAVPRSLAATGGITFCFLFLRVLRCFSSPGLPPRTTRGYGSFTPVGCPIRTSADQRSPAPTRSFSQLATSFVAFLSHRHPPCALSCFLPCIICSATAPHTTRIPSAFSCDLFVFSFVVPVCQSPTSPLRDEEPGGE